MYKLQKKKKQYETKLVQGFKLEKGKCCYEQHYMMMKFLYLFPVRCLIAMICEESFRS